MQIEEVASRDQFRNLHIPVTHLHQLDMRSLMLGLTKERFPAQ